MLERPAGGEVVRDEAVGAVGADDHVLHEPVGTRLGALGSVVAGSVDDHVRRRDPTALELEVAADARSEIRDPLTIRQRRLRRRLGRNLAALDVDQVLVVRAGDLVAVAGRLRPASVALSEPRAARIVERLLARGRLGVAARHDHDAVVVLRGEHGRLDLVEAALAGERPVLPAQRARPLLRQVELRLAGADPVALSPRVGDRSREEPQRLPAPVTPADDVHVPRPLSADGGAQRAQRRNLAAGGGVDRPVRRRVRPVGGPLEMSERGRGQRNRREYGGADGDAMTRPDVHAQTPGRQAISKRNRRGCSALAGPAGCGPG